MIASEWLLVAVQDFFVVYLMLWVQGVGSRYCGLLSFFLSMLDCVMLLLTVLCGIQVVCGACGVIFAFCTRWLVVGLGCLFQRTLCISGIVILWVVEYCISMGVGTLNTHYVYSDLIIISSFFGIVLIVHMWFCRSGFQLTFPARVIRGIHIHTRYFLQWINAMNQLIRDN